MLYFSLTTLTTTGYGDIVAVDPFARSFANLEAVLGQFYLAITVARDEYIKESVDQVALVHTHFVSVAKLVPTVSVLVPVEVPERKEGVRVDYLYEPEPEEVLARLLPRYVEAEVYAAVLDNLASFYAAQMIAMRNATDNAGELITDLTLLRNKVRQATITKELSEIVGGAEALAAG